MLLTLPKFYVSVSKRYDLNSSLLNVHNWLDSIHDVGQKLYSWHNLQFAIHFLLDDIPVVNFFLFNGRNIVVLYLTICHRDLGFLVWYQHHFHKEKFSFDEMESNFVNHIQCDSIDWDWISHWWSIWMIRSSMVIYGPEILIPSSPSSWKTGVSLLLTSKKSKCNLYQVQLEPAKEFDPKGCPKKWMGYPINHIFDNW